MAIANFGNDIKSGGSGGNTTNLKNHLIRKHLDNLDVKKTFIKVATDKTGQSRDRQVIQ